jgi:hypothetical protein
MVSFVGQWKTQLNDCTLFCPAKHKRTFLPHIPPKESCHGTSIAGNSYVTQRLWLVPSYNVHCSFKSKSRELSL